MAKGSHKRSGDELGFLVEHVSGLRATEKMAHSERAVEKQADEFAKFFYGQDHRDFGEIRARQIVLEEARFDEAPRHAVWTLGSRLRCLRGDKGKYRNRVEPRAEAHGAWRETDPRQLEE